MKKKQKKNKTNTFLWDFFVFLFPFFYWMREYEAGSVFMIAVYPYVSTHLLDGQFTDRKPQSGALYKFV